MAAAIEADVIAGYIKLGNLEGLQKFAGPSFDWNQPFSEINVPALVLVIDEGLPVLPAKRERCANLIKITKWLLKAGADPTYKTPQHTKKIYMRKLYDKDATQIEVAYGGHSAVSFAFAWLGQMQLGKGGADWSPERKYVEDIVGALCKDDSWQESPCCRCDRASKDPGLGSPSETCPPHTT